MERLRSVVVGQHTGRRALMGHQVSNERFGQHTKHLETQQNKTRDCLWIKHQYGQMHIVFYKYLKSKKKNLTMVLKRQTVIVLVIMIAFPRNSVWPDLVNCIRKQVKRDIHQSSCGCLLNLTKVSVYLIVGKSHRDSTSHQTSPPDHNL